MSNTLGHPGGNGGDYKHTNRLRLKLPPLRARVIRGKNLLKSIDGHKSCFKKLSSQESKVNVPIDVA